MDHVAAWLARRLPPDPPQPTIMHGDFKLVNLMLDPAHPERVLGLFDLEMSALGDPLVDLGIFLAYWRPTTAPGGPMTTLAGWWSRDEMLAAYASRTGRDLSNVVFYETFALFKIAVVIQQIYFRFLRGQTADARFAGFGARVTLLARQAAALAS